MRVNVMVMSFVAAGALATAPAALAATQRYASPTGSGTTCSQAAPCDVVTAINNAGSGDEVILATGDYGTPSARIATRTVNNNPVNVHGEDGQPAPTLYSRADIALQLIDPGSTLRRLVVDYARTGGGAIGGCELAGDVEQIVVRVATGAGCNLRAEGGTIRDSAFSGTAPGVGGVSSSGTWTLHGVTIYATGTSALDVSSPASVQATNVILHGSPDVDACAADTEVASVTLDHSNYATATQEHCGGSEPITPAGSGTNQTATPLFVNIGAGDPRQAAGSPTIDAGAADLVGAQDFEGDPRTLHGQTDIGADERPFPPDATTGSASGVSKRSATVNGAVTPWDFATTWRFQFGTTTAYGRQTLTRALAGSTSGAPVFGSLTDLTPGTTYHYRVVASSIYGTVVGLDRTLKTRAATPPGAKTGGASKVTGDDAKLSGKVNPHGLATTYWFEYGSNKHYGFRTAEVSAGSRTSSKDVKAKLRELSPGVKFHYRLVAKNEDGTTKGKDRTFETLGQDGAENPLG
jgi:hypothetical protein